MVSKNDVINAIIDITGNDNSKEFTRNGVRTHLGLSPSKQLDKIFEELEKEGFIKLKRTKGNIKYYVLSNGNVQVEEKRNINPDVELFKTAVREVFEEYFGKPATIVDLDRIYDIMKDDVGYASIEKLRIQLGLSLEQFMAKFRDYILKNYELIPGGKEGFIIRGSLYGIIRRKVK